MPFEKHNKQAVRGSDLPFVTIQATGALLMNRKAVLDLGDPRYVALLYDAEEELIGLQPTRPEDPMAYKVTPMGYDKGEGGVSARGLLKRHGVDYSVARRYPVEMRSGVLVLDPKKEGLVVSNPHRGKRGRDFLVG